MSSFLCDARYFAFSLCYAFSVRHFPPSRDCCGLCHLSISWWFSLFVSPIPATIVACGTVLTLVSLVFAPVFSFNSPFFVSAPPAKLTIRGRVLAVVGLAIAPFSSRPPRHTCGSRQVLADGLPSYSVCVSFNYFLRVFPGFVARPFRGVGKGFEEPHL